jgi:S1-C subfamily serine protease
MSLDHSGGFRDAMTAYDLVDVSMNFRKNSWIAAPTALMATAMLLSSCGSDRGASAAQKLASFAPMAGLAIGQESVAQFAHYRSGVVVAGGEIADAAHVGGEWKFQAPNVPIGTHLEVGSAAAVSQDGYYLTCAHNLEKRPVFLCVFDDAGSRFARARVVWMGDPADAASDLAVIHADVHPRQCFTWAPSGAISAGTDIIGWGMGPAAGRMTSTFRTLQVQGIETDVAFHQMPIRVGDGGGPVMTGSGKLVGINSRIKGSWNVHAGQAEIVRPDLDWLDRTIDRDRAVQASRAKSQAR